MRAAALSAAVAAALALGCPGPPPPSAPPLTAPSATGAATVESLPSLLRAHDVLLQPAAIQPLYLRRWATAAEVEPDRRRFALAQLGWRRDHQAARLAADALRSDDPATRRLAAQVVAHLGPALGAAALAALQAAPAADGEDAAAVLWARVVLRDVSALEAVTASLASGALQATERLGGGEAFSVALLAEVVPADVARELSSHASARVRAVAAARLGVAPTVSDVPLLRQLARDSASEVVLAAVGSLGQIRDVTAQQALTVALRAADPKGFAAMIGELERRGGGPALVVALDAIVAQPEDEAWRRTHNVFEALRELSDPRAAAPLHAWAQRAAHPHWRGVAGVVLGELGDLRAAPLLAERLKHDGTLYDAKKPWQVDASGHLGRTDLQRVIAARLLGDLAVLHPDRRDEIAGHALAPLTAWMKLRSSPHPNGMRALARLGAEPERVALRAFAFPNDPLPAEGALPPFPIAFEIAQSALRYVGAMRDPAAFDGLLAQLDRNQDPKLDITQEGLEGEGLAMRGMALRAVAYGAANGLAEWGTPIDARAFERLFAFVEDPSWHEEARMSACDAIPWVATAPQLVRVVERLRVLAKAADDETRFVAECLAAGLARRAPDALVGPLVSFFGPGYDPGVRTQLARALGVAGLGAATAAERQLLLDALDENTTRGAASLAWMLGGAPLEAQRALVVSAGPRGARDLSGLWDDWYRALGFVSAEHVEQGTLERWVENAEALAQLDLGGRRASAPLTRLRQQLENVQYDVGPHSLTRVMLQHRLLERARALRQPSTLAVLSALAARGALMALADEPGELGTSARAALHESLHPAPIPPE